MLQSSPLGRYSEGAAAVTAIALVTAAVIVHSLVALSIVNGNADTTWLDASAGVAVGVVLGQRQTTNGAAKIAAAAHRRLDAMGAPPADDITDNVTPPPAELGR